MNRKWYKGDTHLHTVNSDGDLTLGQLVEKGKNKGLDFMIITDHNYNTVDESYYDGDMLVIQGQEITDEMAHINVWGVKVPEDPPYVLNDAEISFQYEDIPNTIPSGQNETIGNANNANLNGIYHSTNEEEFGETYQYRIQDETIYFLCGLETYEGTYTLNKDTLSISYTRHYGPRRRSPRIRFKRRIPNYKK